MATTEVLFNVDGSENHIYVATVNSYVYRPLGVGSLTSKTLKAPGTVINIPTDDIVAQGTCSASKKVISIGGNNAVPPGNSVSIVPTPTYGIYYQDSTGNIITKVTIANTSTSTDFTVCAKGDASPGIFDIAITMEGPDMKSFYLSKGHLTVVVSAPISYPTAISLPIGGCSSWENITLPMLPPTEVNVSFTTTNSGLAAISPGDFDSNSSTKFFKICSTFSALSTLNYTFRAVVNGTDQRYYTATNPDIVVTVFSTRGNITTSMTTVRIPKGGCASSITITTNPIPTSDVSIAFGSELLQTNKLYTNITSSTLLFSAQDGRTSQNLLICSN